MSNFQANYVNKNWADATKSYLPATQPASCLGIYRPYPPGGGGGRGLFDPCYLVNSGLILDPKTAFDSQSINILKTNCEVSCEGH